MTCSPNNMKFWVEKSEHRKNSMQRVKISKGLMDRFNGFSHDEVTAKKRSMTGNE